MAKSITQKQLKKLEESLQCIIDAVLSDAYENCFDMDDLYNYGYQVDNDMIYGVLDACNIQELKYKSVCRESLDNFDMYGLLHG